MNKKFFFVVVLALVIITTGLLIWNIWPFQEQLPHTSNISNNAPSNTQDHVFCPQDAKLCPDGSYVSRTGPNCDFAQCPTGSSASSTTATVWGKCEIPIDLSYGGNEAKEFDCPSWMQNIYWDRTYKKYNDTTIKFYFYNSLDKKIQRAYLSQKTGTIAFIVEELTSQDEWTHRGFNQLKFIYPDHQVKLLYKKDVDIYYEILGDLKFSPDGKYISIFVEGYDVEYTMVLDISSSKDILEGKNIICYLDDILWSSDSSLLAVRSFTLGYSGDGINGIFLSAYNKPEQLTQIFSLNNEDTIDNYEVYNLSFSAGDNNTLIFVVGRYGWEGTIDIKAKYEYNIRTKELKKID